MIKLLSVDRLGHESSKWLQTIKISITNQLVYKLNLVLYVIAPPVVFLFIKYNLWTAIFKQEGITTIAGYDLEMMLQYQMWVLIIALFAQSYRGINLSEDIRFGRISSYLIYPFDFWKYHTAAFLGHQCIQVLVAGFSLAVLFGLGYISTYIPEAWLVGLSYALLVSMFMFVLQYICGIASFWLEETWMCRILWLILAQFCSGAIVPLELFPEHVQTFLSYTPFPYLTYVPVKMCMGEFDGSVWFVSAILALWLIVMSIVSKAFWNIGLRNYTGAGM